MADDPVQHPPAPPCPACGGRLVPSWGTCEQCGLVGRMWECITSGSLHWWTPDDHICREQPEQE